jgi:hypothetical protein
MDALNVENQNESERSNKKKVPKNNESKASRVKD